MEAQQNSRELCALDNASPATLMSGEVQKAARAFMTSAQKRSLYALAHRPRPRKPSRAPRELALLDTADVVARGYAEAMIGEGRLVCASWGYSEVGRYERLRRYWGGTREDSDAD